MSPIDWAKKKYTICQLSCYILVLTMTALLSCSNTINSPIPSTTGTIIHHALHSEIVGDDYNIYVRLPMNYDKNNRSYPVIFQLDAENQFDITTGFVSELEQNEQCSSVIVVGIGYPYPSGGNNPKGRNRDYTLPIEYPQYAYDAEGGAVNFYQFIKNELIPFLEVNYSIAGPEHRAIIGHSYGGLFVLFSLFQYDSTSPCIRGFLAASPSLWFDGGSIYKYFDTLKSKRAHVPVLLYMSVGEIEGADMNVYFDDMSKRISNSFSGVQCKAEKFKTDHQGNIIPSYENGLRYLFEHGL